MAVTNTTIDLEWTAATDNVGVVSYQIFQSEDNVSFTEIHESDGVTLAYTATGLTPGTQYYFKQTAKDAADNQSTYGNTVTATTLGGVVGIDWDYTKMYIGEGDNVNLVTLYFTGQDADITSVPGNLDWVLYPFNVVNTVTVYTDRVELLVNTPFTSASSVTIDYTPGVNPLKDIDGHLLTELNDQPLDNLIVPSFTYLLDDYPGAAAAYSLRKLRTGETRAVRVRRDSDNAATDVYFYDDPSKSIDLLSDIEVGGTLGDWAGSDTVYVRKWYDQSGNNNDLLQTTNTNQPNLINAGILRTVNDKSAIFNNLDDVFMYAPITLNGSQTGDQLTPTMIMVEQSNNLTATTSGFNSTSFSLMPGTYVGDRRIIGYVTEAASTGAVRLDGGNTIWSSANGGVQHLAFITRPIINTDFTLHYNGVQKTVSSSGASKNLNLQSDSGFNIFRRTGAATYDTGDEGFYGNLQEAIFYLSDQTANRTAIENNINAHYNIWAVTVEVDAQLIQADNDNVSDTVIEINGVRSSASDTAVANLISRNVTVITN